MKNTKGLKASLKQVVLSWQIGNAEASVVYINFKEIKLIVLVIQLIYQKHNSNKQYIICCFPLSSPHFQVYWQLLHNFNRITRFVFKNFPLENLNTLFPSLQTLSISHVWICHTQDHRFYSAAINTDTWICKKFPGLESIKINCPKVIYYTYLRIPQLWVTAEA